MSVVFDFLKVNYLALTSLFVSLLSIIIASRTLNHSKKTTIVIDKYEPLLVEVATAKQINMYEDRSYDFSKLKEVKNSYVYHAFSSKLKKKIELVLQSSEAYEIHRRKLDSKLKVIINGLLEQKCTELLNEINDGYEYDLVSIFFFDGDIKKEVKIFEMFMNDKIYKNIDSGKITGVFDAAKYEKGMVYEQEIDEYIEQMFNIGVIIINLSRIDIFKKVVEDEWGYLYEQDRYDYSKYLEQNSEEIKNEIYFLEDYAKYNDAYNLIKKETSQIEILMQDYIKELLVPHYRLKKFFKRI